jgi:predicted nucleotidyltransferase
MREAAPPRLWDRLLCGILETHEITVQNRGICVMPAPEPDRLNKLVESLIQALSPRRIILFGSRARGEAGPDSDFDLMLVVDTDLPPADRAFIANKAVRHLGVPVDIIVYTPEEFDRLASWPSSIVAAAISEGNVLHASP